MYQVVQTIGSDGKNLLQLLPIPNSSGNLMPLVQSSVMSDALKGNTGSPVQVTFQTQIRFPRLDRGLIAVALGSLERRGPLPFIKWALVLV